MNAYERAVIEAARAVTYSSGPPELRAQLRDTVLALDEHERAQTAASLREIEWVLVVAGDELRGNSGAFYPVLKTKRQYEMGKYTGKQIVTIKLPAGPRDLVRPHGAEPFATVRRSPDGAAVDEFVNVFSSGEASS